MSPAPIELESARREVLAGIVPLPAEAVALAEALGRRLAADAVAATPVQAFDNSAMDGYALRAADSGGASADSPAALRLVGESRAGHPAEIAVGAGEAIAISTGAMLPAGADAVIKVEDTERDGDDGPAQGRGRRRRRRAPRRRRLRGRRDGALGRDRDRRRRARRPRLARPRPGRVPPPADGRRPDQRRRADRARDAAARRRDPRLEPLLAAGSGPARRRRGRLGQLDAGRAGGDPRRAGGGARRRPDDRLRRRLGRRPRPRQAGAGRARRRAGLLAGGAEAGRPDLVRAPRGDPRLRPARQPGLGDGHLPAAGPAGAAGARRRRAGGEPDPRHPRRRLREAGRPRPRRPLPARADRPPAGWPARCATRAPTSSPRWSPPTAWR